jgi:hypothetical protein
MRSTTKLKVLLSMSLECRFRFIENRWELFIVIRDLGEAVFIGKNFSDVVSKALAFSRKKSSELLEGGFWEKESRD